VMEDFVLLKAEQPSAGERRLGEYLGQFQLD
jgi:hypothetical protein